MLSVVLPAFNAGYSLEHTLEALGAQVLGPEDAIEVVVVDDGSTDDTAGLAERSAVVDLVIRIDNSGPSAARNAGAAASHGRYLAFVDCDDEPDPDWATSLMSLVRDGDVGIGRCGVRIIDRSLPGESAGREVFRLSGIRPLQGGFVVRRGVFDHVGGYDAALRYGENSDVIERCLAACRELGLETVTDDAPHITIALNQNARAYDRRRFESAAHLLHRDEEELQSNPRRRARLHGIASVNAARCGMWSTARRHAVSAIYAQPGRPNHYARLLMTLVPSLARRRWSAERSRIAID